MILSKPLQHMTTSVRVSERLLLVLIRPILETLATSITNELGLAKETVAPAVLKHAHDEIRESDEDGRTEAREHRDDAARVGGSLVGAEGLRPEQVAGRVADVDHGEDDGLFGAAAGVGLGQGDEDDVGGCFELAIVAA